MKYRTRSAPSRDGYVITRESMSRANFHRHVKMLTECGLSRAALQNMHGLNDGADIIPFVRFIGVDFGAQHPGWYTQPAPKHVYQPVDTTPYLRLVA